MFAILQKVYCEKVLVVIEDGRLTCGTEVAGGTVVWSESGHAVLALWTLETGCRLPVFHVCSVLTWQRVSSSLRAIVPNCAPTIVNVVICRGSSFRGTGSAVVAVR